MFRIKLTAKAKRELKNLSKTHKHTVGLAFEELKDIPTLGKPLTRDLTGRYTYKMGIFRIVYIVNEKDETVTILTVGHRATVYIRIRKN